MLINSNCDGHTGYCTSASIVAMIMVTIDDDFVAMMVKVPFAKNQVNLGRH